jgi:undecaprenyl-diphosphatase
MGTIVLGSVAAAIVGYLALVVLLKMVKKGQLHRFAPYCWLVGITAIVVSTF